MNISVNGRNGTTSPDEWTTTTEVSLACIILGLSFLVGTPGNILVVWTILKHVRQRSHTVLLILHLAAADLLVLITLPLWIYSLVHSWVFGSIACKTAVYVVTCCMYTSVFLMTAMSVERFAAIRFPFASMNHKRQKMLRNSLVGIWLLAFLLGIPTFVTHDLDEMDGKPQCLIREYASLAQELVCLSIECLMGFIIPFTVLGICYYKVAKYLQQMNPKPKHKSSFLIACVVVAFAFCWIPYHLANIVTFLSGLAGKEDSESTDSFYHTMTLICGALVFISSSVNPILYTFAARRFQGNLRKSFLIKLFRETASHTFHTTGQNSQKSALSQTTNHVEQTTV